MRKADERKRSPQRPSSRPEKVGLVGQQVAENVKAFRSVKRMSLRQLSAKLAELGRPILPSGLTKLEQGERRVDVDDLVALADALGVPAPMLMLGGGPDQELWARLDEYAQTGVLSPVVRAVRDAVMEHGVNPYWLVNFLEASTLLLPIFEDASKQRHPSGQEG